MHSLLEIVDHRRQALGLPAQGPLAVELHAPWRESRTGRCMYLVRRADDDLPLLVLQDSVSLAGLVCRQNPYAPTGLDVGVDALLPDRRGVLDWEGQPRFWASWIAAPSLASLLRRANGTAGAWETLVPIARRVGELQAAVAATHQGFFDTMVRRVLETLGHGELSEIFQSFGRALGSYPLPCTWSHGDLWCQDIFVTDQGVKIVDWEWALPGAPVGCDLVDLYVTTAEHVLAMEGAAAWLSLSAQAPGPLQPLKAELDRQWTATGLGTAQRIVVVIYALIRAAGRILCQEGPTGSAAAGRLLEIASQRIDDL